MTTATINTAWTSLATTQVLDLPQLLERCLGDLAFAERCLVRFQQQLNANLEQLQESVDAGDTGEAARIAHLIKGSAATVAASPLAETASAVEQAARHGYSRDAELVSATTDLVGEVQRFMSAVPLLSNRG